MRIRANQSNCTQASGMQVQLGIRLVRQNLTTLRWTCRSQILIETTRAVYDEFAPVGKPRAAWTLAQALPEEARVSAAATRGKFL